MSYLVIKILLFSEIFCDLGNYTNNYDILCYKLNSKFLEVKQSRSKIKLQKEKNKFRRRKMFLKIYLNNISEK